MDQAFEGAFFSGIMNRVRPQTSLQLFSLPFQGTPSLKNSIQQSSKQIHILFKQIFNSQNRKIQLQRLLPFKKKTTAVPFCYRSVAANTCSTYMIIQGYRCFDCQIHPRSLICQQCFKNGEHIGHRYQVLKQQGVCDCGNINLLKKTAFCHSHQGEQCDIVIQLNQQFQFVMYIRQIFIWVLKLIELGHQKQADKLFLHLVNYLTDLNSQSLYYNRLTTDLIFTGKCPIINNMFAITIISQNSGELIKAVYDLLIKMIMLRRCKEMLLTSLIINYNEIESFQRSRYRYLFYVLLSDEEIVVNTMRNHPIPLNPKRPFNLLDYYSVLLIIEDIPVNTARAFLAPILLSGYIPFPFLEKVEERCEISKNPIVTVFTQFQMQERVYLKIMINIIQIIEDKEVLGAILKHYYSFIRKYSFYLNKIILVPQRVFTLALYKYFDFQIKKVNSFKLSEILQQNISKVSMLLIDLCIKFSECLLQFCQNLNKTTYFENYLNGYAKQMHQIICIDILGIRMLAPSLGGDSFQNIIENIFFTLENTKDEQKIQKFGGWNIFMRLLAQIILSPRTQMVIKGYLSVNKIQKQLFLELFTQIGQISQGELNSIELLFNIKSLPKDIIDELLVFNPIKKKYTPISLNQDIEYKRKIPLEFMVSLLPTRLSKFVQKQGEKYSNFSLNEEQERLKQSIFNVEIFNLIIQRQFGAICNTQHFKDNLKTLMNTSKSLKCLFNKQSQRVNEIYEMTLNLAQTILLSTQDKYQASKWIDSFRQQKMQQAPSENRDLQKKKELMRLKKEQLMKNKKMRQNQEVFIGSKQQFIQNNNNEICLICKESKDNDEMCYLAKMRYSSLLFNLTATEGQNIVFRSCFHTVHSQCFIEMAKEKEATLCPLCKSAVNVIIPLENSHKDPLFEKISARLEYMLSYFTLMNEAKHNHRLISQALLYLAYFVIININRLSEISEKDAKLIKILSRTIVYNMGVESRRDQAEAIFQLFKETMYSLDSKAIKLFHKIGYFIYELFFWQVNWRGQANLDLSTKILSTISDLTQEISLPRVTSIIQLINKSISHQQTSELQPLLIILQENQNEQNINLENIDLYQIYTPPQSAKQLLFARDHSNFECKLGHQILICVFCRLLCCHTCKKAVTHSNTKHQKQCLFFNLSTGGLFYCYHGSQLTIRCLYINKYQKVWKPEYATDGFSFDFKIYDEIITQLKNSNLFCYLITRFEGLKGGNVNDRI